MPKPRLESPKWASLIMAFAFVTVNSLKSKGRVLNILQVRLYLHSRFLHFHFASYFVIKNLNQDCVVAQIPPFLNCCFRAEISLNVHFIRKCHAFLARFLPPSRSFQVLLVSPPPNFPQNDFTPISRSSPLSFEFQF